MAISVRQARLPEDEPLILSFITGLQDYEAAFEPNRRRDPDFATEHWRILRKRHVEKNGVVLIAEDGGKAMGWAFAHDDESDVFVVEAERLHGFLAELYVVPEARSKGFGRALIKECEVWAHQRGHALLMVGVLARNAGAIRSYEGAGFSPYAMFMRRYLGS